jgi:TIP41-like family
VDLYEDELADNGISLYTIKIRVMPSRLLLLARFFLRLDDVIFRIRDTRVYVEFETGEVLRDYAVMEDRYAALKMVWSKAGGGGVLIVGGSEDGGFWDVFEGSGLGCAEVVCGGTYCGGDCCPMTGWDLSGSGHAQVSMSLFLWVV